MEDGVGGGVGSQGSAAIGDSSTGDLLTQEREGISGEGGAVESGRVWMEGDQTYGPRGRVGMGAGGVSGMGSGGVLGSLLASCMTASEMKACG